MSEQNRSFSWLPRRGDGAPSAQYYFGVITAICAGVIAVWTLVLLAAGLSAFRGSWEAKSVADYFFACVASFATVYAGLKAAKGHWLSLALSLLAWMCLLPIAIYSLVGVHAPEASIIGTIFTATGGFPGQPESQSLEPSMRFRCSLLVVSLLLFVTCARVLLRPSKADYENSSTFFTATGSIAWRRVSFVVFAAFLFATMWGQSGPLSSVSYAGIGQFGDDRMVADFAQNIPFLAALVGIVAKLMFVYPLALLESVSHLLRNPEFVMPAAFILLWLGTRVSVEQQGVRFYFINSRSTLLLVKWSRVTQCNLIEHHGVVDTAVLRYRLFGLIPMAIGLHAKHWNNGTDLVAEVAAATQQSKIKTTTWVSNPIAVRAAYALLIGATLVCLGQMALWIKAWEPFFSHDYDMQNFAQVANVVPLTILSLLPVCMIGVAFGLLSAYHRAAPRPMLMGFWMMVSPLLPTPMIHWLVWIAIYAIYTATLGKHPNVVPPDPKIFQAGITLLSLMPTFAGISYVIGLLTGCRRKRPAEQTVAVPASRPESPSVPDTSLSAVHV
ncbi:MAG: hypothetical protein U0R49_02830 [Fimbriimonadales bacterium]